MVQEYTAAHPVENMDLDSLTESIRHTWGAHFRNVPESQRPCKGTFYLKKGDKAPPPKKQHVQVAQKTSVVKDKGPTPSYSGQQQAGPSQSKGKAPATKQSTPAPSNNDNKKKKSRHAPRKPNARNAIEGVLDNDYRFEIAKPTIVHPNSLLNCIESHEPNFTLKDFMPRDSTPPVPAMNHSVASFKGSSLTIRTAKEQKPWKAPGSAPYPNFHKAKSLADRLGATPTIQTVKNLEEVVKLDE